jgi:lipopolysaccharide biosynthesis glycosyltransferase
MKENINFLYCFDSNYNIQAATSIISLLNNTSKKINIYVIHNEDNFNSQVPKEILNHKNLSSLTSYKFNDYKHDFPNIKNVHISVATYFRLFIQNYLPKNEKVFVFLDPDVICIQDPINEIQNIIKKLNNSEFTVAAKTEHTSGEERINVNDKYFNAGVMVIDFEKWQKKDFHEQLIHKLNDLKNNIVHWDQDVLNSLLNGNYLELGEVLNFKAATKINKISKAKVIFIHYMGSHKPWLTSGMFQKDANFYHSNFRNISEDSFHIEHKWKVRSMIDFLIAIFTLKIIRLNKPLTFIFEFVISFFKDKK